MKKLFFASVVFLFMSYHSSAQQNPWQYLAKVKWIPQYDEKQQLVEAFPKFSQETVALEGKEILIKGFVLPLVLKNKPLVIGNKPFDLEEWPDEMCGGLAPEQMMMVFFEQPVPPLEGVVMVRGILKLHPNGNSALYSLENAQLVQRCGTVVAQSTSKNSQH
jgi:hypothetical protein